jgi:hypothetical protein
MQKCNIHVVETEKLIGAKDFHTKTVHIVKAKLKQFITALLNNDKNEQLIPDYI